MIKKLSFIFYLLLSFSQLNLISVAKKLDSEKPFSKSEIKQTGIIFQDDFLIINLKKKAIQFSIKNTWGNNSIYDEYELEIKNTSEAEIKVSGQVFTSLPKAELHQDIYEGVIQIYTSISNAPNNGKQLKQLKASSESLIKMVNSEYNFDDGLSLSLTPQEKKVFKFAFNKKNKFHLALKYSLGKGSQEAIINYNISEELGKEIISNPLVKEKPYIAENLLDIPKTGVYAINLIKGESINNFDLSRAIPLIVYENGFPQNKLEVVTLAKENLNILLLKDVSNRPSPMDISIFPEEKTKIKQTYTDVKEPKNGLILLKPITIPYQSGKSYFVFDSYKKIGRKIFVESKGGKTNK